MDDKERETLVAKSRKGDTGAFAELYSEVYKQMYYYALSNLGNSEDAADAVSDAVLDAFSQIKKLKNDMAFKSWIFTILSAKVKAKQKEYISQRNNHAEFEETEICARTAEFENVELFDDLNALSNDERTCLTLNCIAGYKGEEIAEMLGIPHSTVRSHISRGRAKLKLLDAAAP